MINTIAKLAVIILAVATVGCTKLSSDSRDLHKEEANRKAVLNFFAEVDKRDVDGAMKYIDDGYKQHNPNVADGKSGVRAFFLGMQQKYPTMKGRVLRTAAEGDLVWVHAHMKSTPDDPGVMFVDIFRVKDGKLIEHWDVLQPVPKDSANNNSML